MVNIRLATPPSPAICRDEPVDWIIARTPIPYADAMRAMEDHIAAMIEQNAPERVWLLEHPAVYTAGTSADEKDLIAPGRFPVHRTGRGGQYTYHGPGQRVAYAMLDLTQRGNDVRAYVCALENWIISALDGLNIKGERREDRVGVWVRRPERSPGAEDKIAALGIRVRRGRAFHGIAVNVDPDLEHFSGIVPCGVSAYGVTSLADLGHLISMPEFDMILRDAFEKIFGPTRDGFPR
ncbi:MAG: lipoyl(octanoyl) transferase LipB [Rhodobiaceae bacterium]|nr:lipoyl(octanoyl) transferase LipB [Rhodobiaceae bacterium]